MSDSSKKDVAGEATSLDRVNQGPVRVGDKIPYRVEGISANGASLVVEPVSGAKSLQEQGWLVLPSDDPSATLFLVPLKSGDLALSELVLKERTQGGDAKVIATTRATSVSVGSTQQGASGAEPPPEFLPPVSVEFPWETAAIAGAILLVLLAAALFFIIRHLRKRKPTPAPAVPVFVPKPEDEQALERVEKLAREKLWTKGQHKSHYFQVSELLKEYFGSRYHFDAKESTSHELMLGLEKSGMSTETLLRARQLFDILDRVKFTDHLPESAEAEGTLTTARELVQLTRKHRVEVSGASTVIAERRDEPRAF